MIFAPGTARRTSATIRCVGAMHQRSNSSGGSTPAQVSKICTASTPACELANEILRPKPRPEYRSDGANASGMAIGEQPRRRLIGRAVAGHHVGRNRPGRAAEAEKRHARRAASALTSRDRFVDRRQHGIDRPRRASSSSPPDRPAARAAGLRRPRSGQLRPSACGITRMSENRIAASKPKRRIGCSVTSAASFGVKHRSSMPPTVLRTAMYSGR